MRVGTRCQDVPGETALTPSRPAKRGHSLSQNASVTVTVGNGGATEHVRKQSFLPRRRYGNAPIFLSQGRLGRQTGWVAACLVDICILLSDVLQNDTSHSISYALMYHIPKNVVKQEGEEELSVLPEQAVGEGKITLLMCVFKPLSLREKLQSAWFSISLSTLKVST